MISRTRLIFHLGMRTLNRLGKKWKRMSAVDDEDDDDDNDDDLLLMGNTWITYTRVYIRCIHAGFIRCNGFIGFIWL